MEPNTARAEAERWLGISAKLLAARDLVGSRSFAIRAREADPNNPISDQILAVVDTLISAEKRVINSSHHDWYSILQLSHLVRDPDLIASQYRRLVLLLNPDHNHLPFADYAFRVVVDAWSVLSDPTKKWLYDSDLSVFLQRNAPPDPEPVRVDSAASATYQFFQQPAPTQTQAQQQQQQWIHHLHEQQQQHQQQQAPPPQLQERQLFHQQHQPQPQPPPQPQHQWLPQTQPQQLQQLLPEQQQRPSQPLWLPQPPQPPLQPPQPPPQQQQPPPQWLPEQHRPPPQPKEPQIPPQLQRQQPPPQQQKQSTPPHQQKQPPPPPPQQQKQPPPPPQQSQQPQQKQPQQSQQQQLKQPQQQRTPTPPHQQKTPTPPHQQRTPTPPPPAPAQALPTPWPPQQLAQQPVQQSAQQLQRENSNGRQEERIGKESNVGSERVTNNGNKRSDLNDSTNNDDNHDYDGGGEQIEGFWTACPYCYYLYEYAKTFEDCTLRCQNCRRAFHALQIPNPPGTEGRGGEASFCSWGVFPLGFSMTSWKKSMPSGGHPIGSNWVPFSPMFACPVQGVKKKAWRTVDEDDEDFHISDSGDDSDSSDDWGSTKKRKTQENVKPGRGRPRKSSTEREKKGNQNSVGGAGGAGGDNLQRVPEMQRNANHGVTVMKNDVINKIAAGGLKKQLGKGVRGRKKLDLNVEFSNEVEDHAHVTRDGTGEEVVGFFEGLDEFLSTLPILKS